MSAAASSSAAPSATAAFQEIADQALSPAVRRQQVDAALEYALEALVLTADRPSKPLLHVAKKLREWDECVNGKWPLRGEAERVFVRADVDKSGELDLSELTEMRQSETYAGLMLADVDVDLSGKVSLQEWLLMVKGNVDRVGEEATRKMLELYDAYLSGASKPRTTNSRRRDMAM